MPSIDNRKHIKALEKAGELIHIQEEVDWDCEVGAIVRRAGEIEAEAQLFENIRDYPGHRILGGVVANWRRAALAMGLPADSHVSVIIDEFYRRSQSPVRPVLVDRAPCQENVLMDDEVDLTYFPAPMVHDGDGGRYLSTWHFVVTKDPDGAWTNWGMYRQMVHNERLMGGLIIPASDAGKMKAKYEAKGMPMPFATVIGPDPLSAIASAVPYGVGEDEVNLAGGLMKEPIQLVKCKTVDIEVPAHAEIILEGEVLHGVQVDECPFGEYTGYRSSPRMPRSVYRVKCITFRNNPITVMSNMGIPVEEGQICWASLGSSSGIRKVLDHFGMPVTGVYVPPEGAGHLVIVGIKKHYEVAMQIANMVFSSPAGMWSHEIIIVDDTVDIFNLKEVIHAMATKCHPVNGVHKYPSWGHPLAPYLSLHERTYGKGGRVVIDATWPMDWDEENEKPVKSSFKTIYSQEMQEKVLDRWQTYGFKKGQPSTAANI